MATWGPTRFEPRGVVRSQVPRSTARHPASCILHPASGWLGSGLRLAGVRMLVSGWLVSGWLVSGWLASGCAVAGVRMLGAGKLPRVQLSCTQSALVLLCGRKRNTFVVLFPHTTPRRCSCPFWCSQNASTRFLVVAVLVYTKHLFSTFLKNIFGVNTL